MKTRSLSYSLNTVKIINSVIAITIAAVLVLLLNSCSPKAAATTAAAPPPSLPVASIVTGTDTTYQEYPASIEGTVNVEIRPQVSGSLDKVFVDEGAFRFRSERSRDADWIDNRRLRHGRHGRIRQ